MSTRASALRNQQLDFLPKFTQIDWLGHVVRYTKRAHLHAQPRRVICGEHQYVGIWPIGA